MYALVLLKRGAELTAPPPDDEHEAFIDSLIRRNAVLLGGLWGEVAGPFLAAYLLRCFWVTGGGEAEYPSEKEVQPSNPYHEGNPAASTC